MLLKKIGNKSDKLFRSKLDVISKIIDNREDGKARMLEVELMWLIEGVDSKLEETPSDIVGEY